MAESLNNKIAAITGAASGIGLACAEALIAAGVSVVMVDRDLPALQRLQKKYRERVIIQFTDLLDPASCAQMVPEILAKTGRIDIMHANAGCYIGGDLVDAQPDAIDRLINLNVSAVIKNVRDVLPHMIANGSGDIIVTSSVAGHFPVQWEPVYSASKWALTSFVQTTRRQIQHHGVRIGSVSPGPVISALLADWPEENLRKAKESGSLMAPSEVAEAIVFMLTRPRTVTIRDIVILPSAFDI